MSNGHFEFWTLDGSGDETGTPQNINTDTGVILQCHNKCNPVAVRHLCAVARQTHNYPVDITVWRPNNGGLLWSARIYWRSKNNGQ